jgi:hypothetical protein
VPFTKNIHNFFQGLPNPGFRSVRVQTDTFFKKDSQDFKNSYKLKMPKINGKNKSNSCNDEVLNLAVFGCLYLGWVGLD